MEKIHETLMTMFLMVALSGVLLMPMSSAQQMDSPMQMPSPEIEVTSIVFSDTDAIEGQDVTITITIENMNSTMNVDDITLSLYLDYEIVQNFTVASLAGGDSETFDYIWDSESGTHNVTAMLVIEEMPLMDSQVSEELVIGLGDISSILIALLVLMLAVLIVVALPSMFAMMRK